MKTAFCLNLSGKLGHVAENRGCGCSSWNDDEALKRGRAAQGHRDAQYSLGNLYFEGDGVPKDQVKAIQLYWQSADQG